MNHTLMAGACMLALSAVPVRAEDGTKAALREFGWEGIWSQDCSVSNVFREEDKRVLPRMTHAIPWVGPPTNTIELFYASERLAGVSVKYVYTVTSARMVAANKLVVTSVTHTDDDDTTSESVETMIEGKVFTIRSAMSGVVKKDMPAGRYSVDPLHAGDSFTYDAIENGVSLAPDGSIRGGPTLLEKCAP